MKMTYREAFRHYLDCGHDAHTAAALASQFGG